MPASDAIDGLMRMATQRQETQEAFDARTTSLRQPRPEQTNDEKAAERRLFARL